MSKKGSDPDVFKPTRGQAKGIATFVENAGKDLTSIPWVPNWKNIHGEGRAKAFSSSGITAHIKIRKGSDDGHHWSGIFIIIKQPTRHMPVEGTLHDWGTTEPSLIDILNHYKLQYGKPLCEVLPENGEGPANVGDNPDGQGGEAPRERVVLKDNYGDHYYLDQDNDRIECDEEGTPTGTDTPGGGTDTPGEGTDTPGEGTASQDDDSRGASG